jgi:hypothetical protein
VIIGRLLVRFGHEKDALQIMGSQQGVEANDVQVEGCCLTTWKDVQSACNIDQAVEAKDVNVEG